MGFILIANRDAKKGTAQSDFSEGPVWVVLTDICYANMLFCMRTTLNLDDDLMRQARRRAADTGRTLTQVIEESLRDALAERAEAQSSFRLKWTTARGRLLPGVDLSDRDSLIRHMEERT